MDTLIKSEFDLFDEIKVNEYSEDEELDWEFDDLDQDLSDASGDKTVLD